MSIKSPNGRIKINFFLNENGAPRYFIELDGKTVLRESKLGLIRNDADFSANLKLLSASKTERINERYEILTAKRRLNAYQANRVVFHLGTADGKKIDIIFQVSDDGVAFRYFFSEKDARSFRLTEEKTSFHFPIEAKAWLQPMAKARTGWKESQPSYEEYYEKEIPVGTPSRIGAGWVFPALFRAGETWVSISESNVSRNYCGTRLRHEAPDGEYQIGFPDPLENKDNGAVNPESKLPWATPWRVVALGSLEVVSESMLGVAVAEKPKSSAKVFPPGKSSWSWVLLGDDKTEYETQKRFIDYAAAMRWQYCLIDALWDKQIGYEKIKELVDYARTKNVKILLWYNSAGDWNSTPQTPRGWQRTYPNLMTMEAIRGFEFVTFEQRNADEEATHAAMLPFTRNIFDPMDFTPVALERVNSRIQRRTTSSFELALSVLFTSGIQHYAETPEGMAKTPEYVQEFMRNVPNVWDDVKFIDGYPGKFAVFARRGAGRWYVAGINGEANEKKFSLDLSKLSGVKSVQLITDGDGGNLSFEQKKIELGADKKLEITIKPRGGFVLVSQ